MAGQGQQFRHQVAPGADDFSDEFSGGQAQMRRPHDFVNQPSHPQGGHDTMTGKGANFLHQTGEQMKNMAQGAADAVKHTLGMNTDNPHHSNLGTGTGTNFSAGQYGSSGIGSGPAGGHSTGHSMGGTGTGTGYGTGGTAGTGINHPSNRNTQI